MLASRAVRFAAGPLRAVTARPRSDVAPKAVTHCVWPTREHPRGPATASTHGRRCKGGRTVHGRISRPSGVSLEKNGRRKRHSQRTDTGQPDKRPASVRV